MDTQPTEVGNRKVDHKSQHVVLHDQRQTSYPKLGSFEAPRGLAWAADV